MGLSNSRFHRKRGALTVAVVVAVIALGLLVAVGSRVSAGDGAVTVTTVQPGNAPSGDDRVPAGHVSDAEMRESLTQLAECVREAGYEAEVVDFVPGLSWRIDIAAETEADAARASAALDECSAHVAGVVDAYLEQNRLAPTEQVAFETLVRECLEEQGVQLDEDEGKSLAARVSVSAGEQFTKCQAEALERFR